MYNFTFIKCISTGENAPLFYIWESNIFILKYFLMFSPVEFSFASIWDISDERQSSLCPPLRFTFITNVFHTIRERESQTPQRDTSAAHPHHTTVRKNHLFSGRSSVNELNWPDTAHKTPREAQRHMSCVTVTAQSLIVSSFKFGSSTFGFLMKFRTSQVTAVKSAQCYFRRSRTQTLKT